MNRKRYSKTESFSFGVELLNSFQLPVMDFTKNNICLKSSSRAARTLSGFRVPLLAVP
jgi:hypothetical protein